MGLCFSALSVNVKKALLSTGAIPSPDGRELLICGSDTRGVAFEHLSFG